MPSTMIHLMLAQKLSPKSSPEFFIGNIAPDAIAVRKNHHFSHKDKLHFRKSSTRLKDIETLAESLNMQSPYCVGYIMHLFLDMHWDADCMQPFIADYKSSNWVIPYRTEISKASAFMYHNDKSLRSIWDDMVASNKPITESIQGIKFEEIEKYYKSNHIWYLQFNTGQSRVYSNDFIDSYTDKVAEKYIKWNK